MINPRKTWFLAPSWDIPPSAIRLGHIISEPTEPRHPLNPAQAAASYPQIDTEIFPDIATDFYMKLSGDRANTIGIWAQFLHFVGLTAEVRLTLEKGTEEAYSFEKLETQWFSPSLKFARESMEVEEVKGFLSMAGLRTPLYMVTGVKTVTGGSVTTSRTKGHSYGGKIGVDGTPASAAMSAGPEYEHSSHDGLETSFKKEDPIVFAYQLMRIKLQNGNDRVTAYNKGAIFGVGQKEEEVMQVDVSEISVESSEEFEDDLEEFLEDAKVLKTFYESDQTECTIIAPQV